MTPRIAVERLASPEAVAERGAAIFCEAAAAAARRGRFRVALAGGTTPSLLHRRLASSPWVDLVVWRTTHIYFGDERCVPECSPDRNDMAVRETLLSVAPVPPENVHRIEATAPDGAERYERLLIESFAVPAGEVPRFDLVFLGIGDDGHTASLFPGDAALESRRLVVRVSGAPKPPPERITMTLRLFAHARLVVFLATGAGKARAVAKAVAGDPSLPAGRVAPLEGQVVWLLDAAAASGLGEVP